MSLATKCDRCGKLIGEASDEKEFFDAAVILQGVVAMEFEDLCPQCMKMLTTTISSFSSPQSAKNNTPSDNHEEKPTQHPQQSEKQQDKPVENAPAPEPKPNNLPERSKKYEPYREIDENELANAIVKSIPIKKRD